MSDSSKGFAVRVAKIEPVAFEDNEKTFAELQERIAKTIRFLEGVKVCLLYLFLYIFFTSFFFSFQGECLEVRRGLVHVRVTSAN